MLLGALWLVGLAVLAGLGLSCFYLLETPIRGRARWASAVHGTIGAAGVVLFVAGVAGRQADAAGFSRIAAALLAATLLAGLVIAAAHLRRRRPAGLVVILHAIAGVAGATILLAYASVP